MSFAPFTLQDFLDESNRIEGMGPAEPPLVTAAEHFLALERVEIGDMAAFVKIAQPNAVIRDKPHLNVRVSSHVAPRGGRAIIDQLVELLDYVSDEPFRSGEAHRTHVAYETLHPFTDGNGRSGRMLWLWMMGGIEQAPLGFLHHWYYQSLQHSREPAP